MLVFLCNSTWQQLMACRRDADLKSARQAVALLLDLVVASRFNLKLLTEMQRACQLLFGQFLYECGDFIVQVRGQLTGQADISTVKA